MCLNLKDIICYCSVMLYWCSLKNILKSKSGVFWGNVYVFYLDFIDY